MPRNENVSFVFHADDGSEFMTFYLLPRGSEVGRRWKMIYSRVEGEKTVNDVREKAAERDETFTVQACMAFAKWIEEGMQ